MDFNSSLFYLCLFAVAISGLLLALPTTRRRWNDLAMAFKTVPCGCLTALLVPSLLSLTPWLFFHTIAGGVFTFLLTIAAAIGVIFLLVKLFRKIFKVEQTYHSGAFVCLFILLTLVLFPASCVLDFLRPPLTGQDAFRKGPWINFNLPEEPNGTRITFQQRSTHAFLAEYDYRFILKRGKEQKTYYLFPNCGGRTAINLYRLSDGRLLYEDKDGRYLIDTDNLTVSRIAIGLVYAPIPENQPFNGCGTVEQESDETPITMEFHTELAGTQRVPATRLPEELYENRQFYGCLAWGDRDGRPNGFSRTEKFVFANSNW